MTSDKTIALVTGAAGGLGQAITKVLVDANRRVVAVDIDEARLTALCASFAAGTVMPFVADISKASEVRSTMSKIVATVGAPTILVNNAGITDQAAPLETMSDELWDAEMSVHATASFYWTRACLPFMKAAKWGRIVNISSIAGSMGDFAHAAYSASKSALHGLTRSTALESARFGITANAVLPGIITTPAYDRIRPDVRKRVEARTAMKRSGTPAEVATVVGFLASEDASYLTGQLITVDGGVGLFVF